MKFEWSTVAVFGIVVAAAVAMAAFKLITPETAIALVTGMGGGSLLKQAVSKPVDKPENQ